MSTNLTLEQGTTRTIRVTGIVDAAGDPLDITGWTVHAQARHKAADSALLAEWHTDPTGDQGDAAATGSEVVLQVPPAMSAAWGWAGTTVALHIEITEPGEGGRVERIADARLYVDPEVVR